MREDIFGEEEEKLEKWEIPFEELFHNLDNINCDTDGKVRFSAEDVAEMVMAVKQKIKPLTLNKITDEKD